MDIRDVTATSARIDADVCVVGTGPAGLTLAQELSDSGLRVILLESGAMLRTEAADALNEVVNVGAPRAADQWLVRNRLFGGSSVTWSGRLATFDEADFAERDWVPGSGWPIGRHDVAGYFARTLPYFGSNVADNNGQAVTRVLDAQWPGIDREVFRPYGYSYSQDPTSRFVPMRFAALAQTRALAGITCYVNATVVTVDTDRVTGAVTGVTVASPDGVRTVSAPRVVLATGAVENARLLLASKARSPKGLGNDHDVVGRYLMDHPRGAVGHYEVGDHFEIQRVFRDIPATIVEAGEQKKINLIKALALTPDVQRREHLLNCALFVFNGDISEADPLRAFKSLARRHEPGRQLRTLVRGRRVIADNLHDRLVLRRPATVRGRTDMTLQCMVEQRPNRDSRVTLSDRTDGYGCPLPKIDWRLDEQEARTVRFAATRFAEQSRRLGLPVPVLSDMVTDPSADFYLPDVAHPTGTTRMSADATTGVVDRDCAVHGVPGLFVAGSSVFPTGGHANPTQMIVALTLRLADHLKQLGSAPAADQEVVAVTTKLSR